MPTLAPYLQSLKLYGYRIVGTGDFAISHQCVGPMVIQLFETDAARNAWIVKRTLEPTRADRQVIDCTEMVDGEQVTTYQTEKEAWPRAYRCMVCRWTMNAVEPKHRIWEVEGPSLKPPDPKVALVKRLRSGATK